MMLINYFRVTKKASGGTTEWRYLNDTGKQRIVAILKHGEGMVSVTRYQGKRAIEVAHVPTAKLQETLRDWDERYRNDEA